MLRLSSARDTPLVCFSIFNVAEVPRPGVSRRSSVWTLRTEPQPRQLWIYCFVLRALDGSSTVRVLLTNVWSRTLQNLCGTVRSVLFEPANFVVIWVAPDIMHFVGVMQRRRMYGASLPVLIVDAWWVF